MASVRELDHGASEEPGLKTKGRTALERKTVSSTDEDKSPISGNLFTAEKLLHNYYIYDDSLCVYVIVYMSQFMTMVEEPPFQCRLSTFFV